MVTGFMTVDHVSNPIRIAPNRGNKFTFNYCLLSTFFQTLAEWYRCFMLTSGVLLLGAIIFCVFGSSEAQPWSLSSNIEKKSNPSSKHHAEQAL